MIEHCITCLWNPLEITRRHEQSSLWWYLEQEGERLRYEELRGVFIADNLTNEQASVASRQNVAATKFSAIISDLAAHVIVQWGLFALNLALCKMPLHSGTDLAFNAAGWPLVSCVGSPLRSWGLTFVYISFTTR